jgi:hypothetical protein
MGRSDAPHSGKPQTVLADPEEMDHRCCRFCHRQFQPSRFHLEQTACSDPSCQQQRRSQSRQQKLARDAEYRQVCRDSSRKWRANHPGYWKPYRAAHPDSVARNRTQQRQRDLRRRLADLANNHSALDLKSSTAGVWWLGPAAQDLANNNLAAAQVFILQGPTRPRPLPAASCKQHPSGVPPVLAPYSREDAGFAGP